MIIALIAVVCSIATGIVVYLLVSKKLAVANAELKLRGDAILQLRADSAEAISSQASLYDGQITKMNTSLSDLQDKLRDAQEKISGVNAEKVRMESELKAERDKVVELRQQYDETMRKAEDRFKTLAQSILEERSAKLQSEGEKGIKGISDELQKYIRDFRDRVETINKDAMNRNVELGAKITGLINQTNIVSNQANNLADAIRGKAQVTGEWGEMQLKRVLELGGLQESVDYTYQETFASVGADHKDMRTDVLVKMTDGRWMVIDSKATVAAYSDLTQAKTEEERESATQGILESVKKHIDEMKLAAYHKNIEQITGKKLLNTMLMYIPFEDVYLMAMKASVKINGETKFLREYARENDIVLINSTGLLPVVRMLADFWATTNADKKAMKIKEAAEALVDKFRTFIEGNDGFLEAGKHLAGAVKCYNESLKRLSSGPGNIMKKVRDMKDMGVNTDTLPAEEEVESRSVEQVIVNGTSAG